MYRFVDREPALILQTEAERILVISDIHIGCEKGLAEKGIKIPSLTPKIYERIERIASEHRPDRIVLSGDIKHGTARLLSYEWRDIPEFFERLLALGGRIEVVPGNHDGGLKHLLPREVTLHPARGVIIQNREKILITHGHTWPVAEALSADLVVMGHNHFSVEFREATGVRAVEPVWVVARWDPAEVASAFLRSKRVGYQGDPRAAFRERFGVDVGDPEIVIVPAFNPMLGGMKINRPGGARYISPILQAGGVDLERADVYLLDHTYLGRKQEIRLSEIG